MPSLKAIRTRITSVKNTRKITRAMKLVSTAKLRRSQDALIAARPYSAAITRFAISRATVNAVSATGAASKLVIVARRREKYWLPLRPMIRSETSLAPDSSFAA